MTFQEAVNEYIQQAHNFERWYLEQNQQDPENFPLELQQQYWYMVRTDPRSI